jgi:hypothetical protein
MGSAAVDADDASSAHQPGHSLAAHADVQTEPQLGVHEGAVGATAAGMDVADLLEEGRIGDHWG